MSYKYLCSPHIQNIYANRAFNLVVKCMKSFYAQNSLSLISLFIVVNFFLVKANVTFHVSFVKVKRTFPRKKVWVFFEDNRYKSYLTAIMKESKLKHKLNKGILYQ